uniref:Uncharacterized protein n=1 Tax=Glossina brevipalpis TaxID=37001 RepID=A0A1A9WTG4_9MUSC
MPIKKFAQSSSKTMRVSKSARAARLRIKRKLRVRSQTSKSTDTLAALERGNRFSRLIKKDADQFEIRKSLKHYVVAELEFLGHRTYYQRVFILARNASDTMPSSQGDEFVKHFQRKVKKIFGICEEKKTTPDNLSGLFICMDTYTYLMLEGAENMLADFFNELATISDTIWSEAKIFLVENNVPKAYFKDFITFISPAINVNEKFPPNTPNDFNLMAIQHFKLIDKVQKVLEAVIGRGREKKEIEYFAPLPADPFNKLLPEIQRINLVLSCDKFYLTLKRFAKDYFYFDVRRDDDSYFWPIENSYTPLDIFTRSPFDINLTFSDYGKEEKKPIRGSESSIESTHSNISESAVQPA